MLEAEHAHFIQGGVAICLAARDAVNRPAIARGLGCKMLDDGRRVAVFLAASQAPGVLDNIAQNGAVAAVFCLPSSNRTLQLKGTDAVAVAPQPGDAERIRCYVEAFAREVEPEGFRPEAMRVFLAYAEDDLVCVAFTPSALFTQTPGPLAGTALPLQP